MISASVGSVELSTPLLLASGHITESPDFFVRSVSEGCSGMVTRSLRETVPEERRNIPSPRYHVFGNGSMLNCEWSNQTSWQTWLNEYTIAAKKHGALIVSLSARDIEGCVRLARQFARTGHVDAFEVNVSCAHSGALHGNLNINYEHLRRTVGTLRSAIDLPVWVKLSYSPLITEMALEAEREGADCVVTTNSIGPGLFLDINTTKPTLGVKGGAGGVTGDAVFPIALWCVYTLSSALAIPVVGSGGVNTGERVIQMIMAGASAVQLYTAPALEGPGVFKRISCEILRFLESNSQYPDIRSLIGVSQRWSDCESRFNPTTPIVNLDKCRMCAKCVHVCGFSAMTFADLKPTIDSAKCVGCNACVGTCPHKAITTSY